jgi:hypothetical protein
MEWNEMIGKEVFCKTKTSGVCSGKIIDFLEKDRILIILDKFNERWFISIDEILRMKEEPLNPKNKLGIINSG